MAKCIECWIKCTLLWSKWLKWSRIVMVDNLALCTLITHVSKIKIQEFVFVITCHFFYFNIIYRPETYVEDFVFKLWTWLGELILTFANILVDNLCNFWRKFEPILFLQYGSLLLWGMLFVCICVFHVTDMGPPWDNEG